MAKRKKSNQEFPYATDEPIEFESIYPIIHYIQSQRKECSFMALASDAIILEHIMKDSEIKFSKITLKKGVRYSLQPPTEKQIPEDRFIFDEELPDEIVEDGQCF